MITKRPRRLDHFSYEGYQRYFVTACAAFKRPLFASESVASGLIEQLLTNACRFEFVVVAYCVMPDHLHVLVEATSDRSDLLSFVKRFKQVTGFAYRRQTSEPLWQPGYHERVLRNDEATDVIRYILENPIRAGLAAKFGEYPHAGPPSMV
jgi:putative transposase